MNKQLSFLCSAFLLTAIFFSAGTVLAQNMTLEWAKSYGGKSWEHANAIATDAAGNVYVTGAFSDTVDFDPGAAVFNMVAKGSWEIYVLKLDAAGGFVWARQMGGVGTGVLAAGESGHDITIDAFGDLLVCGDFGDTADFDPGPGTHELIANGREDAFILKLDTAGNFIWAKSIGAANRDYAKAFTTDAAGSVFITGQFRGTVDLDPGPGDFSLTSAGSSDIYVLKLTASGDFEWASQLYGVGINGANDLTLDNEGNLYVAGYSRVTSPTGGSGTAVTIWKLDSTGDLIWVYQSDDEVDPVDMAESINFDPSGYLYVTGHFYGQVAFGIGSELGSDTATSMGLSDIFIMKMDTTANFVWLKAIGSSFDDKAYSSVLDASGNIYITGFFSDTADFDPGPLQSNLVAGGYGAMGGDVFLLKMDSEGNYQWAYGMGSEGWDQGVNVNIDQHGAVYITGVFGNDIYPIVDFDPGPGVVNLTSNGQSDAFVQKFSCNDTSSFLLTDTACVSYTLNGETYAESGTYTQVRPNAAGCDSIITLQLTIAEPDPIITVNEFTLGATISYATYQWLLNGAPISGATQAAYTVTVNGNYAVAVTNTHGCADTSEIYTVDNVGTEEAHWLTAQIGVYPNPAHTQITIESTSGLRIAGIRLFNILGAEVYHAAGNGSYAQSLDIRQLANGMYLLHIETDKGVAIQKLDIIR